MASPPRAEALDETYTHAQYCRDFGKRYASGVERRQRAATFARNLHEILRHNRHSGATWRKGVNKFTDWTHAEFSRLNGVVAPLLHREMALLNQSAPAHRPAASTLLPALDWRTAQPPILTPVKDQGNCGSCWTFGTTETVEAWWAQKTGNLQELSEQFLLDCTPNPNDCGGTGGCQGATASLAIATILARGGQPSEWTHPYVSYYGVPGNACQVSGNIASVSGLKHLGSNANAQTIMQALQLGPLIVNVDASSWQSYESGIIQQGANGCALNATIDHVVQLVGYGHDASLGQDYWLVRNSWSPQWGEHGYVRLSRQSQCGTDNNPLQGNICTGGPLTVPVCGTCGIFYSVSHPIM